MRNLRQNTCFLSDFQRMLGVCVQIK
ncbi:mCG15368 [Mus musculus]|nr:mCG15368 [Mus musculus]